MPPSDESMSAQVLIKLGEIGSDVAVIKTRMEVLPDHEQRLRALERARWPLPTVAGVAAVGSAVAAWVAVAHH